MDSFVTSGEEALTDVKSLEALGASRVLIPAGMFGSDPAPALQRYADEVIAQLTRLTGPQSGLAETDPSRHARGGKRRGSGGSLL